jgi:hypothetical protein
MINLRKYENLAFNVFIITSYILTAFFLTGVSTKSKEYLYTIDKYVKIYISLYLLWRFNPFGSIKFVDLDRNIAFSSGLFLFTTTVVNELLQKYFTNIKQMVL